MVIAVTGTPGTGKTVFSEMLAKRLNALLIRVNDFVERRGIYETEPDGTKIVEVRDLKRELKKEIAGARGTVVVEGHMSHFIPKNIATHIVVLRTDPAVLRRRLEKRRYTVEKVMENVESEALDIVLWEAFKEHGGKVLEIDTTWKNAEECVDIFLNANEGKVDLSPGKISWLEKYVLTQKRSNADVEQCTKIRKTRKKR